jgi:sugar O-acyltransferase (sialic acid O-acetyltransferase NeuD family)
MRVGIIGASGHAKVVYDAATSSGIEVAGFVDECAEEPSSLMGMPVATNIEDLDGADAFVIAIGDNETRRDRFEHYRNLGIAPATVAHASAVIADEVVVGAGTVVFAGAVINPGTTIGENTIINSSASIDHDCEIGRHAHVAPGSAIAGNVSVGEGAFLGIGTTVVPDTALGPWSTCGAGSVVLDDVAEGDTVVGVPARSVEG